MAELLLAAPENDMEKSIDRVMQDRLRNTLRSRWQELSAAEKQKIFDAIDKLEARDAILPCVKPLVQGKGWEGCPTCADRGDDPGRT